MIELWLGEKPFKGIKAVTRNYLIAEEKADLPADMPSDYATLIQGLIRPQRKDRWGQEQVKKWLNGEALAPSKKKASVSILYDPLKFSASEYASNPGELAALMEKYSDMGKSFLYDDFITGWLKKAGDVMLFNRVQNIASQYASDKDAGLYTAIFTLDPERSFKSRSGKICKTAEDIADAIMAESAYYMEDLKRPNANLYLYLATTEGSQGKEAADVFCKYFKEYSPKRALALVYFKLQSDGGITIGTKHYQSPDELKHEKDCAQIDLVKKAVTEKDSMMLVWLSDIYGDNLKSTEVFSNLSIPEQFFLLGLLPFLSFKEFGGDSWDALRYLIDSCLGRSDLFEIYVAQGLPLTGQGCGDKRTPIDYAVCCFNELSGKHGTDTVYNLIRLLHKLGADENQYREYKVREAERKANVGKYQKCVASSSNTVGLKVDGTVVAVGWNKNGECNVRRWRDIVAVATGLHTVGLKADGTVVAVGRNDYCQCNVSGWRDIGPVPEEKIWEWRGLCKFCGGKLGGLFTKKCKVCGKEQ